LRKTVSVLLVTASLPIAAIASPAHAGDGGAVAAGIFGGLAAGTLLGIAVTTPRYAPPPPVYVGPEPVGCYWTHGRPYWDDYRTAWVYPRVRVCE
jgi:hypothetical protein